MNTYNFNQAPREVQKTYNEARESQIDRGATPEAAHQYGLRMVRLAGWYRTSDDTGEKWQRLTPDVREKVNVREAMKQPDGRYLIQDVDVFYPNAVKSGEGGSEIYSPDDIRACIRNTNSSIAEGGWRPTLIEGHQHPAADMLGSQFDGHGYGINWRESPRGEGWAMCDLADVEPEYVERIRQRKLPGLSARISNDAGKLNRRFGHIAMLGGTPPALSRLPMLEVFSVSDQVCFSADEDTFSSKGRTHMPMNKEHAKKMAGCFAALGASYASYAAGEPGCEEKLHEAHGLHLPGVAAHMKDYGAELGDLETGMAGGADPHASAIDADPKNPDDVHGEFSVKPNCSNETELAEDPELSLNGPGNHTVIDFSSDPEGAFKSLSGKADKLVKVVEKMAKVNAALQGKLARTDFAAECDGYRKEGYQLPEQKKLEEMWQQCFSASDPRKAIESLRGLIKSFPKGDNLADFGAGGVVFGANGATPINTGKDARQTDAEIALELSSVLGRDFSADDVAIGGVFANSMRTR